MKAIPRRTILGVSKRWRNVVEGPVAITKLNPSLVATGDGSRYINLSVGGLMYIRFKDNPHWYPCISFHLKP